MSTTRTDQAAPRAATPPRTSWAIGLVLATLSLGLAVSVLESDLIDEVIPTYISSDDFDVARYEAALDAGELECVDFGDRMLDGQVECAMFDGHGEGPAYGLVATLIAAVGAALVLGWSNPIGWLIMAAPLIDVTGAALNAYAIKGVVTDPGSLPGAVLAALIGSVTWIALLVIVVPLIGMTIPNGHLPSPRWRWGVWFASFVSAVLAAISVLHPMLGSSVSNPIGLGWSVEDANSLAGLAILGMVASWAIAGASLISRLIGGVRRHLRK